MAKAYVFPGRVARFVGMSKDLYETNPKAKEFFDKANDILGFRLTGIMFNGMTEFMECGLGQVLTGLIGRIQKSL